jgi:hypothetical protein
LTLLEGDTVQDARRTRKPATGRALDAVAPALKPRGPYKKIGRLCNPGYTTRAPRRAINPEAAAGSFAMTKAFLDARLKSK